MNAHMILIVKRQIKDWLRRRVESLPFDLGNSLLHVYRKLLGRRKKIYTEKKEARRILSAISRGKLKKALVVYDRLSSPPTFGDYFYTIMLARYFASQNILTEFVIVDGEYRKDWLGLDKEEIKRRGESHQEFAKLLLDFEHASVETVTWTQFQEKLEQDSQKELDIIFRNNVLSRSVIYSLAHNILNYLCIDAGSAQLDQFLLSMDVFSKHVPFKKVERPYITYHCRRSEKSTSLFRNTRDDEFLQVYSRLKELYPNHIVIVLSDIVGFEYFKKLARKHDLECQFSKQYSDSFFGDCGLLLGGEYHFTLRGGGIDAISLYSKIPYEHFASPINDDVLENGKANAWSTGGQLFTDIKWSPNIFLPSGNVKLDMPSHVGAVNLKAG